MVDGCDRRCLNLNLIQERSSVWRSGSSRSTARSPPLYLLAGSLSSSLSLTSFVRLLARSPYRIRQSPKPKNGRAFPCRRRYRRAFRRAPAAAARCTVQRRPSAVDEERQQGRISAGARGGRRGGGGQHVPHRRRRGRGARRHRLPHLLLPQGHVPRVRRRRLRAQVRLDAARERGEEGPAADRLRQLQRPRQARTGRQVDPLVTGRPIDLAGTTITSCTHIDPSSSLFRQSLFHTYVQTQPLCVFFSSFYVMFIRLVFQYMCRDIHALCCVTCGVVSMLTLVVL